MKIFSTVLILFSIIFLPLVANAEPIKKITQDNLKQGILSGNMCITTYTSEPCGDESSPVGTTFGTKPSDQLGRYQCTVC